MKRHIAWVAILGSLALAAPAGARPSGSETITTTLLFPSFPTTPPLRETYTGTFSASGTVSDTGTVTDQAQFGAVPSRGMGVLQQVRTLSGSSGTLTLRCNERFSPPNQPLTVVSDAGSCVVHGATGAYAGLRGSGSLTGTTDFGATPVTIEDTLTLGAR